VTVGASAAKPVIIIKDRVHTEAVEVNAARHCNISCRSCSHGSPLMQPSFADPGTVERDLLALTPWMHVDHVRVLGGEPLLHPRLVDLLRAIRRSGLGDRLRLLTNGLWLRNQPSEFWREVDEVHVSVYPNTAAHIERDRQAIIQAAQRSGTGIVFINFDYFRIAFRHPDDHPDLTQDIYETCQIANRWRCISVDAGRLYRCPQSMLVPDARARIGDSLCISTIDSADAVRSWLLRAEALRSCGTCTGSAGLRHPHQPRVRGKVDRPATSLDLKYLATLRIDPDADNGCVSTVEAP